VTGAGDERALRTFLVIAYLVLTIVGLFVFQGIPVFNVAAGFPVGAAIAWRALKRERAVEQDGGPWAALQTAFWWALTSSAATVLLCWIQLGAMMLVIRWTGPYSSAAGWIPLLPMPQSGPVARMVFFTVVTAPALQMLSTSFGAVIAVLLFHRVEGSPGR